MVCSESVNWRLYTATATESVESHRGDDNGIADDDVLAGVGNVRVDAAIVENRHDQAANQSAENGSFASAQTATANDDGGDDLKLQTVRRSSGRRCRRCSSANCRAPARPAARPPIA